MATYNITIGGVAQPALAAPLAAALALDVVEGWADVSEAEWTALNADGGTAVLGTSGPIVAPPFTNTITLDLPGSYSVFLRVVKTDLTVHRTRAIVQVQHPGLVDVHQGHQPVSPFPAPFEVGDDPDYAATGIPNRDATYGWAQAAGRAARVLADLMGYTVVPVRNASLGALTALTVVRPTYTGALAVYQGGPGGAAPAVAKRKYLVEVVPVDGTDVADAAVPMPWLLLLKDVDADGVSVALIEGMIPNVTITANPAAADEGQPVFADASGQLFSGWSPTPADPANVWWRQVGTVLREGTAGLDPPGCGALWFNGRARGAHRLGPFSGPQLAVQEAVGPAVPTLEVVNLGPQVFWKGTIAGGLAVDNSWRVRSQYLCHVPMSQWQPSSEPLFVFYATTAVAGSKLKVTIEAGGAAIYDDYISSNIGLDGGPPYYLRMADLSFAACGLEPMHPGRPFYVTLQAEFGPLGGGGSFILIAPMYSNAVAIF